MVTLAIEHIKSDESGRPYIAGTRIRVQDVALWHQGGWNVGEIVEQFELTPGQVHAALSYYYDHKDEVEGFIAQEEANAEDFLRSGKATSLDQLRKDIEARRKQ